MNTRYFQASDGWIRAVSAKFSWLALLLGPMWAFANRAWLLGIVFTVAAMAVQLLGMIAQASGPLINAAGALFSLTYMYSVGRYGNTWLVWSLRRQGYKEIDKHAV